ncbi:hypothetical protein [Tissierella praeacuta]|uniref:hypothetical protein n=1 Tax=Tissierella praeacuta TaxID=43131 RepID=UPI00333F6088
MIDKEDKNNKNKINFQNVIYIILCIFLLYSIANYIYLEKFSSYLPEYLMPRLISLSIIITGLSIALVFIQIDSNKLK